MCPTQRWSFTTSSWLCWADAARRRFSLCSKCSIPDPHYLDCVLFISNLMGLVIGWAAGYNIIGWRYTCILRRIADSRECPNCSQYRRNPINPPETNIRPKKSGRNPNKPGTTPLKYSRRPIATPLLAMMAPTNPSLSITTNIAPTKRQLRSPKISSTKWWIKSLSRLWPKTTTR